jgi:hypothetical protein
MIVNPFMIMLLLNHHWVLIGKVWYSCFWLLVSLLNVLISLCILLVGEFLSFISTFLNSFLWWHFEVVLNWVTKLLILKGALILKVIKIIQSSFFRRNLLHKVLWFFSSCTILGFEIPRNVPSYWFILFKLWWTRKEVILKGSVLTDQITVRCVKIIRLWLNLVQK